VPNPNVSIDESLAEAALRIVQFAAMTILAELGETSGFDKSQAVG
jgi:hypothetical protein